MSSNLGDGSPTRDPAASEGQFEFSHGSYTRNALAPRPEVKEVSRNLLSQTAPNLSWDNNDRLHSLDRLYAYVTTEAQRWERWYWQRTTSKARFSRTIQMSIIVLGALGGLFPLALSLNSRFHQLVLGAGDSGVVSALCVGLAASLMGLDKFFGFSSAWARFVVTGTNIRKALEEFRMDWMLMSAQLSLLPESEQVTAMINRAKALRMAIEGMVITETQDWLTEFRNNTSQMERDVYALVERLKLEASGGVQYQQNANTAGSLVLKVANAEATDDRGFRVILRSREAVIADEAVVNSSTWARTMISPGHYELTVTATTSGRVTSASTVVVVRPGELTEAEL